MVSITLCCVGNLKEPYLRSAVDEYRKRLSRFCKLNIIEISEVRLPDNPHEKEIEMALEKEGDQIFSKIPKGSFVFSLCIEGKQMPTMELAKILSEMANKGTSHFTLIIGGSYGLSPKIKEASGHKLSMSSMTFPHQLARVILLEQIYRICTIQNHMPYHK